MKYSSESEYSRILIPKMPKNNILFIDDDYVNYLYFAELISKSSLRLIRVCSLTEALNVLQMHGKLNAVIVCGRFTEFNNFEVVRKIKQLKPAMPVLAVSDTRLIAAQKHIGAGYDLFLSNHIDEDYLIETLRDVMDLSTQTNLN